MCADILYNNIWFDILVKKKNHYWIKKFVTNIRWFCSIIIVVKEKINFTCTLSSYHEIGTRDLPAMIDYVLNYTNQKTLHYIGLSMANTELFALLSIRPEYNAKIKLGICFAPIAIWKEIPLLLEYIFYWNNMILNFKVKK